MANKIATGLPVRNRTQTGTARLRAARGQVHKLPADLRAALVSDNTALAAWEDITPLARNEWICWVISAKKPETRQRRIRRTREELAEGKPACRAAHGAGRRRPCCWAGCLHR